MADSQSPGPDGNFLRRPPRSTYRLQLHPGFTFDDAGATAPYLKDLGVSHIYSSPYLQAAPGSIHGYNVVDHQEINQELGGEEGHRRFCDRLRESALGQLLDIVPNHMATGPQNRYWWDVLENGPSSRFATWFDIDWNSDEVRLQGKVLIPVLGDQYGRVLAANQIRIEHECSRFRIRYLENLYPLRPRSLTPLLMRAAQFANSPKLSFLADSFARLPLPDSLDQQGVLARHRDQIVIYDLLRELCEGQPAIPLAISQAVDELNKNLDGLDEILNLQHYRLAYWRTADQELGYRRFSDINTLIGLRVERPEVFDATHRRVLEWLRDGAIDGVRVDHPDGLRDPEEYFRRLRDHAPDAWVLAEKILQRGERPRRTWPVQGTTGYDFLNVCSGLLIYPPGMQELTQTYQRFIGEKVDFATLTCNLRENVAREMLGSDVNRLTSLFLAICENNRDRRDYTRAEIRRAVREIGSCFSVYRAYIMPARDQVEEQDRAEIDRAVALAKTRRPDLDAGLMDFIGDVLALRVRGGLETEFLLRFQQFTSPVMAKGLEDTAFYCFNRLIALNEVGGAPDRDGVSIAEFHDYCAATQADYPFTMNTLTTHDTKRSEDVRARLAVLAEVAGRWTSAVNRWSRMNARFKTGKFPDHNSEYFLYQTLVGAWPIDKERVSAYMEKAAREAKQQTSWTQPNKEFEDAVRLFIERILESESFTAELETFVAHILRPGRINSLAQTLIKYTAPGVPDTYQGSELWDLRLVDPDNRGPVDFALRQSLLADLKAGMAPEEILRRIDAGYPKLWVIYCALQLRERDPEWFGTNAVYTPLTAQGPMQEHVVAFLRGDRVVTCIPRWNAKLAGSWSGTVLPLPEGRWKNVFTADVINGGNVRIQALLHRFPVALLIKQGN